MSVKFRMLYLGRIECARFRLIECEDETEMIKSPMVATLIQHPTLGNILYDTGNSPFYNTEYGEHINEIYPIPEFISIEDALLDAGLTCDDIDMIILSHMHFDHTGGLRYFTGKKAIQNVYVAELELRSAFSAVMRGDGGAYVKTLFDVDGIQYKTYSDELDLGDGLRLFEQHSHTEACTGLILETAENGVFLLTSDTIYTKYGYEHRLPPGGHINKTKDEYYRICDETAARAKQNNATIIFGHDFDQVLEYNKRGLIK